MPMKKRILSVLLAVVMTLGIIPPAMAYDSPDFSDLPSSHWAYDAAMRMADQGVILGTGNGEFSPTMKVSAGQFLTLVGRAVFTEEAMAQLTDHDFEKLEMSRDSWYGPYMVASWVATYTVIADMSASDPDAEVTRTQMAVVLARAIITRMHGFGFGLDEKEVDTTAIKDFDSIPDKYKKFVAQTYAYGLIQGDENGNFNGDDTMTRAEVAVVMDRLMEQLPVLKETQTKKEAAEEAERQALREAYDPDSIEVVEGERLEVDRSYEAMFKKVDGYPALHVGETLQLTICQLPAGYHYTKDNVTWTSENEDVATISEDGLVTAIGEGYATIRASVPIVTGYVSSTPDGLWWGEQLSTISLRIIP